MTEAGKSDNDSYWALIMTGSEAGKSLERKRVRAKKSSDQALSTTILFCAVPLKVQGFFYMDVNEIIGSSPIMTVTEHR